MRAIPFFTARNPKHSILNLLIIFFIFSNSINAINTQDLNQQIKFRKYKGIVLNNDTNDKLVSATLLIKGSNISTITNSEGHFTLKVPEDLIKGDLIISMLGYQVKVISISQLKNDKNIIRLKVAVVKLEEVIVNTPLNARKLVEKVFNNRNKNYFDKHIKMTAFYRESIKKGKRNVSLAEAIVEIYKQPYMSLSYDKVKLYKARKNTDYRRLDTVALKLQGGPFNALFIDMIKYPEYIFYPDNFDLYNFNFLVSTTVKGKTVYVINFVQKESEKDPLFYGKLYIDTQSKALVSAVYDLNITDKKKSARLFVKKKPRKVSVYPTRVHYRVDYRQKGGKWYYAYGNSQLTFKVKRKGKWFHSKYSVNSEMAVTNWEENPTKVKPSYKERMKHSIIIGDEASGFSDPEFWGSFNVIEPDKSIESAIKKIKRQLIK
jgi:hypothetical protein